MQGCDSARVEGCRKQHQEAHLLSAGKMCGKVWSALAVVADTGRAQLPALVMTWRMHVTPHWWGWGRWLWRPAGAWQAGAGTCGTLLLMRARHTLDTSKSRKQDWPHQPAGRTRLEGKQVSAHLELRQLAHQLVVREVHLHLGQGRHPALRTHAASAGHTVAHAALPRLQDWVHKLFTAGPVHAQGSPSSASGSQHRWGHDGPPAHTLARQPRPVQPGSPVWAAPEAASRPARWR